jgi:hypothetical protein
MAGHAARALWNLTSKHTANQDAVREAGAIPPLVDLLAAPNTIKVLLLCSCVCASPRASPPFSAF